MSNIHQLEVSVDPLQDRLILRIYTQDMSEFRFWLTRRFTKILWQILVHLLQADQKSQIEHEREKDQVAEQFQREQSQRQPLADKYSNKLTRTPLGAEPILLSRISGKILGKGHTLLKLEDEQKRSFEITADSKILLSLCKLLTETSRKADWELNLDLSFN